MPMLKQALDKIIWLNHSQLVADFQQACGIEFITKKSGTTVIPSISEIGDDSYSDIGKFGSSYQNGVTDTAHCNGHTSPSTRHRFTVTHENRGEKNGDIASEGKNSSEHGGSVMNGRSEGDSSVHYKIRNKYLHYLFLFGATLGNESFNCIFFSHWFWNVDGYTCRRIILLWSLILYFGQAAKDVIQWPRPNSPPVAKLEKRYELEYGMPSTHAMVAVAMPTATLYFTMNRYLYPWAGAVIFCIFWGTLVCFSRIYLGMHSVLDVIVGIIFSSILTWLIIPWLDAADDFQVMHPYGGPLMVLALLCLSLCYPKLGQWSTCRGDTVMILGVSAGSALGAWLAFHQGVFKRPDVSPPYPVKIPNLEFFLTTLVRFVIGGVLLALTRLVVSKAVYYSMCYLWGLDTQCPNSKKRLRVELPLKYITYIAISFNVCYTSPLLFRLLGVERETVFTEL